MLLCRRRQRKHGASCPSSNEIPVMLDLLEFSDWQLAQAPVEACHLSSSHALLRHVWIGSRTWYDVLSPPVRASLTRLEDGK